jgi:diacylglycerol kinase family enzyme
MVDARTLRIRFDAAPRFELDGEVRRARDREIELSVQPGVLNVVAPAPGGHSTVQST